MRYGYRVVYGGPDQLKKAGYEKVSHLTSIMDSRSGYHRLGSRFLIDRGLGLWDPHSRGTAVVPIPPSSVSMKSFADRLANFLEWCDVRGLDPLLLDYTADLIRHYQVEMQKGIWSRDAKPLAASTINARMDVAAEYLTWSADKGLREPFFIPKLTRHVKTGSAISAVGHLIHEVHVRKGNIRQPKRRLGLPLETKFRIG